ncbi:hypothetical protein [Desulforamulus aquiferis]|uniref:Uncharacterized protein n=1 Tax=Desulforamulus aquiferis TaxID=1397668 RepID=A0AAW7Z9S5_9FIRM|nr:hypothetical protein [Desulforamulus aquiferis]MDO7786102.1 hypothetical protein [Desulforamulus aquiferis]
MKGAVLFCLRCGSETVDINHWEVGTKVAEVRCSKCGMTGFISGFTLGRIEINDHQMTEAKMDRAIPWWFRERD